MQAAKCPLGLLSFGSGDTHPIQSLEVVCDRMKCTFVLSDMLNVLSLLLVMYCIRLSHSFTATPFPCRSLLQNSSSCRLYHYKSKDLVQCFDTIHSSNHELQNRTLHFAFVGDSRVREEFHNFWPVTEPDNFITK